MYIYELIKLNIYLIFIINNIISIINTQYYLVHFCFQTEYNCLKNKVYKLKILFYNKKKYIKVIKSCIVKLNKKLFKNY